MPEDVDGQPPRDARRPPFCYQTHDAIDAIRRRYDEEPVAYGKLSVALGIYLVLTEAANRAGGASARSGFRSQRKDLAALAGVGVDTFDAYVAVLEEAGVLEVAREMVGKAHLPNVWTLVDPSGSGLDTGRAESATPGRAGSALRARDPLSEETTTLEEGTPPPPEELSPALTVEAKVAAAWTRRAPPLTAHRPAYFRKASVRREIARAASLYGDDDVCAAIEAFAVVLVSDDHLWTYSAWGLEEFLRRGLDRFVPEARPMESFRTKRGSGRLTDDQIRARVRAAAR